MTAPAQSLRRFTRLLYLLCFLDDCVLLYPVYIILFLRAGLSVYDISLLLALWSGVVLVLEIPTGMLADVYHRPTLLTAAMLAKALGFACWWVADGFWMFALGFAFWGVKGSLASGARESLAFDTLQAHGVAHEYTRIIGRAGFYSKLAIAASFLLGGALATYSFALVLAASVAAAGASAVVAGVLGEAPRSAPASGEQGTGSAMRGAWRETVGNRGVRRALLYVILGLAVYGTLEEYDQVYREWIGMPLLWFGSWSAALMGGQALAARFAYRLGGANPDRAMAACALGAGGCLGAAACWPSYAVLPVYACAYCLMAVADVLVRAQLQHKMETGSRATLTSVASLAENLSAIGLTLMFGMLSAAAGLRTGYLAFAVALVLAGVPGLLRAQTRAGAA